MSDAADRWRDRPTGGPAAFAVRLLANWLWPPQPACCGCGAPAPPALRPCLPPAHLCPSCLELAVFDPALPLCPRCSRPLDGPWSLCPACAAGPAPFGAAAAVGLYRPPLSRAITRLKYRQAPAVAQPLGKLLAAAVRRRWPDLPFAAVVPVPLHRDRMRRRGYNQAFLLAQTLARQLQLPLRPGWLVRIRPAPAQAGLGRRDRLDNLAGALCAPPLRGRPRVLLVDDVLTTGATLLAAAAALRAAGAGRVDAAVVAVSTKPVW